MKKIWHFLINLTGWYFLGAVTLLISSFMSNVWSLPIWAIVIIYPIVGYVIFRIYKLMPEALQR